MNDNEDLELQALERQLDDAFETTRPRAGFEDALWSRMQARRSVWVRAREYISGFIDSIREAPAVPATAVAVVLIVAIGVGIVSRSGLHFGGGASTTSLSNGGAPYNAQPASGAFGPVPAPGIPAAGADTATKTTNPTAQTPSNLYVGPARLTWAGQLSVPVSAAPVFRYQEPTSLDADRFAVALGASPAKPAAGALGEYSGDGFVLGVAGSNRQPPGEPMFFITPDRSKLPPPSASAADAAAAFLGAHSLVPTWPFVVVVDQNADVTRVSYLRQFVVPGYGPVYLVSAAGVRYGLEVDLRGGQPLQAFGPMPLNLEPADYRLISADQAVHSALASSQSAPSSAPAVRLTSAELVYALANAGDHSFYEPAFLFSGTFTMNGVTYVKRVLVPAVVPSQLSS